MKKPAFLTPLHWTFSIALVAACSFLNQGGGSGNMPAMELDQPKAFEIIKSAEWHNLEEFAAEQYEVADFVVPGTVTYTVSLSGLDKPIFFHNTWCASDEETLSQNAEHIDVTYSINDRQLAEGEYYWSKSDYAGLICVDQGVLLSAWPPGEHHLKIISILDEKLNDGFYDYEPGEYVLEYVVTAE